MKLGDQKRLIQRPESAEKWGEGRQALSTLGPMEGGGPNKAWQGPSLGESEIHSEARTDLKGTFQGGPFLGSQSPSLKRQVLGVLGGPANWARDGPASPAPPRRPAWVSPRQQVAAGHTCWRGGRTTKSLPGSHLDECLQEECARNALFCLHHLPLLQRLRSPLLH